MMLNDSDHTPRNDYARNLMFTSLDTFFYSSKNMEVLDQFGMKPQSALMKCDNMYPTIIWKGKQIHHTEYQHGTYLDTITQYKRHTKSQYPTSTMMGTITMVSRRGTRG